MSFILDALKKSETERQQQAGAEFSNVPLRFTVVLPALVTVPRSATVNVALRFTVESRCPARYSWHFAFEGPIEYIIYNRYDGNVKN